MARYEHLPIYKQAMDAAIHGERVAARRWSDLVRTDGLVDASEGEATPCT